MTETLSSASTDFQRALPAVDVELAAFWKVEPDPKASRVEDG